MRHNNFSFFFSFAICNVICLISIAQEYWQEGLDFVICHGILIYGFISIRVGKNLLVCYILVLYV